MAVAQFIIYGQSHGHVCEVERQKRDEESARWILTETARSVEAARESSAVRDTGPLHMTIMTRT